MVYSPVLPDEPELKMPVITNSKHNLINIQEPPEFLNSAGRLLLLIRHLKSPDINTYLQSAMVLFGLPKDSTTEYQSQFAIVLLGVLSSAYKEFLSDIKESSEIPEVTKSIIIEGVSPLNEIIYPYNFGNTIRDITPSEVSVLRMAGSMLSKEGDPGELGKKEISDSIANLQETIDSTELPPSVRIALSEIVRLSRNAHDQYNIYGARGFKKAFKRMLSELMEVYLEQGAEKVKDEDWWDQALKHLKTVDEVAGRLLKYKPLLEGVSTLVLGQG